MSHAAVVLLLLATAPTARAEDTEGLSFREHGERRKAMLRTEVGWIHDRTGISAGTGQPESTGRIPTGGMSEGQGVNVRMQVGFHGWYGGFDIMFVALASAPAVVAPMMLVDGKPVPPRIDPLGSGANIGSALRAIAGRELRVGPLLLGAELGIGMGSTYVGGATPDAPWVDDVRLVLDARARAGVWVTPHLSISALAGASLVHHGDRTFSILVGVTPFWRDGT